MKRSQYTYRYPALLLLMLFVSVTGWRASHHLFAGQHDSGLHCEKNSGGDSHIHDDRFALHNCFTCAFVFSWFENTTLQTPAPRHIGLLSKITPTYQITDTHQLAVFFFLRAPPALLSS